MVGRIFSRAGCGLLIYLCVKIVWGSGQPRSLRVRNPGKLRGQGLGVCGQRVRAGAAPVGVT